MSEQDNLKVVETLYAAFLKGDGPGIMALLDENIDWKFVANKEDVPFGGHYRGHEGMMQFFGTVAQTAQPLVFESDEMFAAGDKVVSLGHERVRVLANDRIFETEWVHVFTIQNGKIVRLREYYDTASIAKAFNG